MFPLFSLHMYDFSCIMNSLDLYCIPIAIYNTVPLEKCVVTLKKWI